MSNSGFLFLAATFCCLLAVLFIFKAIPPNRWFGLRTHQTVGDPGAWYRAHRAVGWIFLAIGFVVAALSLWPTTPAHPALGVVAVLLVAAALVFVYRRYAA